jgi:hypothetical protein
MTAPFKSSTGGMPAPAVASHQRRRSAVWGRAACVTYTGPSRPRRFTSGGRPSFRCVYKSREPTRNSSQHRRWLPPSIEIVLVAARPDQSVDAGTAAEYLAHRQRRAPSEQRRIRLRFELPVACAADIAHPGGGIAHRVDAFIAAGFEQQHANIGIFRERRATTHPDVPPPQTMKSYEHDSTCTSGRAHVRRHSRWAGSARWRRSVVPARRQNNGCNSRSAVTFVPSLSFKIQRPRVVRQHRNVGDAAHPQAAQFILHADHARRVAGHHGHDPFQGQTQRQHAGHGRNQAEARFAGKQMRVVGGPRRVSGAHQPGAHRPGLRQPSVPPARVLWPCMSAPSVSGTMPASSTVRATVKAEMRAMTDVDLQAARDRFAHQGMQTAVLADESRRDGG